MAFPNLTLTAGGALHAQATGTPDNGHNTFSINMPAANGQNNNWINIKVVALGASVTGASLVSISADNQTVTINFTQSGSDQCRVEAELVHSIAR